MTILVTGGAGYIGSHMAHALVARGERVVVIDNLVSGNQELIPRKAQFVRGSVGDAKLVRNTISKYNIASVFHFAGSIGIPQSIDSPLEFYNNNTACSRTLLECAWKLGVQRFVFSSTAAVYDATAMNSLNESSPAKPTTPYGRSKLMVEWMLKDVAGACGMRYTILRYFNVAGIGSHIGAGRPNRSAMHLIARAARVAFGLESHLEVFGVDYPTCDGTAVRDYIHVSDLVEAHILAFDAMRDGGPSATYNCGYGTGASVFDVVSAVEKATGRRLRLIIGDRRRGDAAYVVADTSRLRKELGWRPRFNDLDVVIGSALAWELRRISDFALAV